MSIKINIGSHNKRIKKFISLDGLDLENVDAVGELGQAPYLLKIKDTELGKALKDISEFQEEKWKIKDNTVDYIQSIEFLEHISFRQTYQVLKEWKRILKPNGIVEIQVPDCGKMMEMFINNEICDCIPHKVIGKDFNELKADENCFACGGKGKVNPLRWIYAFIGAQKNDKYDVHRNIFTKERMEYYLKEVGFREIVFVDDIYKIKVKAKK